MADEGPDASGQPQNPAPSVGIMTSKGLDRQSSTAVFINKNNVDNEGLAQEDGAPDDEEGRVRTLVPRWRTVFTGLTFFIALIVVACLTLEQKEARAGVVIATTALLWCTEAMPLAITALVPAILFPLVGTMSAKAVAALYWNDISMLMLGTFMMAEAVESCGLHRRIALGILSLLGRSEALLLLGTILVTWKQSMFLSNTATTAMMLPIIGAIIDSLRQIQFELEHGLEMEGKDLSREELAKQDKPAFTWFCKGLILAIPYGASMGGIATLTGTPPNLVFKLIFDEQFGDDAPSIDYNKWISFAYPISFLIMIIGWHVLVIMYARQSYVELMSKIGYGIARLVNRSLPPREETKDDIKWKKVNAEIRKRFKALGPMCFAEWVLIVIVVILVLLWLLREPDGFPGWAEVHLDTITIHKASGAYGSGSSKTFLSDAWTVLMLSLVLFNIPKENPLEGTLLWKAPPGKKFHRSEKMLDMATVMAKTPWDVIVLLGGGYALANGCKTSGLSEWLGQSFSFLVGQKPFVIALVISVLVACLTEVASNTASTTLLMPILAEISKQLKLNPLYLMITGTISASLAFCLPSATGPNALVFSFKEIKVIDMLRTGVFMNGLSVLVAVIGMSTWGSSILGIDGTLPDWAL